MFTNLLSAPGILENTRRFTPEHIDNTGGGFIGNGEIKQGEGEDPKIWKKMEGDGRRWKEIKGDKRR